MVLVQRQGRRVVMLMLVQMMMRVVQTLQLLRAQCINSGLSCRARCLMMQRLTGRMRWWLTVQPSRVSSCAHLCWKTCQTWPACAGGWRQGRSGRQASRQNTLLTDLHACRGL
jgi:hypothetical protein